MLVLEYLLVSQVLYLCVPHLASAVLHELPLEAHHLSLLHAGELSG